MLDGNPREFGTEFQGTLPEYTRLDLKRSVLGIGLSSFPECHDRFKEDYATREGVTFPDVTLRIRTRLL